MYVGKTYGHIIVNVSGSNMFSSDGSSVNQTFTWDGAISASAPLPTSYIDTGIYRMFSSRQPPQIADIASLQSTLSTYITQTQVVSLLGSYYTQGQIDDTIDQKYNFILNGGASTQWIRLGEQILSSDIMNSREWSIKITMSMDKSVASDYTLIIQFKSSDSKKIKIVQCQTYMGMCRIMF